MRGYSKELEEKLNKQPRKEREANGHRSSRMMTFRIDADVAAFLDTQLNKGRTVNDAVRRWMDIWKRL